MPRKLGYSYPSQLAGGEALVTVEAMEIVARALGLEPTYFREYRLALVRRELNSLINDIRFEVDRWRARGYPGVDPQPKTLLMQAVVVERTREGRDP